MRREIQKQNLVVDWMHRNYKDHSRVGEVHIGKGLAEPIRLVAIVATILAGIILF